MLSLEEDNNPKCYTFSWEVMGYDSGPDKIVSSTFQVNFLVTEWHMELDLSNLRNVDSSIPFRLVREPKLGPDAVTFDVKITVRLSENKDFKLEKSQNAKVFSSRMGNHWDFDIDIPSQKLGSSDDVVNWLSPKNLLIDVEMRSPQKIDPEFPKKYWYTESSLRTAMDNLKTLLSDGCYHDLLLRVPGKDFKLHKCILNARWPTLASKLEINDSSELESKEFSDIPTAILECLLNFAYFGDLNFMYNLNEIEGGTKIFKLVRDYNFYRLNDQITQLSSTCSSSQILQSYRTSVEMKFTNVTSTEKAMGDFRTCEIPLKPRILKKAERPLEAKEKEKFHQHIRFMDIRIYVDKGALGYNWLKFSITLGKKPEKSPVNIKCKLYVVGENNVKYLLTQQDLEFRDEDGKTFSTQFMKDKIKTRYHKDSEPVILWRELIDEQNKFTRTRQVTDVLTGNQIEKKDIHFRFELKLADGEYLYDTRHGECEFGYKGDYKIFGDLELMYNDEKFTNIQVTSGNRTIQAHKAILAARSEVLRNQLKNPRVKSLPINIPPDNLNAFIHYLYSGRMLEVPADKIDSLVTVAEEYGMPCLKEVLNENRPPEIAVVG